MGSPKKKIDPYRLTPAERAAYESGEWLFEDEDPPEDGKVDELNP